MPPTRVGGIPEIYGPLTNTLIPPDDAAALASAIASSLDDPMAAAKIAQQISARVAALFSRDTMVDGVLAGYRAALDRKLSDNHG